MEKSQIWLIVGAIVIVSALILRVSSPTNRWVCEHGVWVADGNPRTSQPTSFCANDLSIDAELKALANILNNENLMPAEDELDKLSVVASSSEALSPVSNVISDSTVFTDDEIDKSGKKEEEIILISPQVNEVVRNGDVITGRAQASWLLEGDFPLIIKDRAGVVLATGLVQAQDDSTIGGWTSFQSTLVFNVDTSTPAELFFKKNNPLSLPQYEEIVSYPVRLEP